MDLNSIQNSCAAMAQTTLLCMSCSAILLFQLVGERDVPDMYQSAFINRSLTPLQFTEPKDHGMPGLHCPLVIGTMQTM